LPYRDITRNHHPAARPVRNPLCQYLAMHPKDLVIQTFRQRFCK
jgi:hypothetical protein